jgi:uncharacterized protein (TIGR04562 family)
MTDDSQSCLDIPWEIMETVVLGRSAIDVSRLYLSGIADAEEFLRCYGFDLQRPEQAREVEEIRREALEFIVDDLLVDEPQLIMPPEIRAESDVRRLLLWASVPHVQPRQKWACSILRVMHTFAHCGSYFQDLYGDQIREQIRGRVLPHIHQTNDRLTLGEGPDAIPLKAFQMRGRKSRRSIALKLLHKAESVSADVFDWIGLRFVTEHRFDALLVARYLRAQNVIIFANVRPGRSRNTLLDMTAVRACMAQLDEDVRAGRIAEYERWRKLREQVANMPYPEDPGKSYNPFSAAMYHSIQFTCSQQIRVNNPHLVNFQRSLNQSGRFDVLSRAFDRLRMQPTFSFFFPFEVQVMDHESFERSRHGRASHGEYKARQRHAVKRRLWGDWVDETVRPLPETTARRTDVESDVVTLFAPGFQVHG